MTRAHRTAECTSAAAERTGAAAKRTHATSARIGAVARCAPAVLVAALLAAGCSHMPQPHWPWHRKPPASPQEVHELVITTPEGAQAPFPQYWNGNTLVVDLKAASGEGSIVLEPREHTLWPVRIAFRVMPGQFGVLEVRGKQRVVLPVTTSGTQPFDLELAPGVYIMKTPQMRVSWGAATQASGS